MRIKLVVRMGVCAERISRMHHAWKIKRIFEAGYLFTGSQWIRNLWSKGMLHDEQLHKLGCVNLQTSFDEESQLPCEFIYNLVTILFIEGI